MTPEQLERIVHALEKLATKNQPYTITGAADWPILVALGFILVSLIGFMWRDLRGYIKDNRSDWKEALTEHKSESKKENDIIWAAMRDCQSDCCPRVKEINR